MSGESTNKTWIKYAVISFAALLLCFGGFLIGRAYTIKRTKPKVVIEYVQGETIRDSVKVPVPYEVIKPVDTLNFLTEIIESGLYSELFPYKVDTLMMYIPTSEDTLAIVNDYGVKRLYKEKLFDNDTLGKFEFNGTVQYNRLMHYDYSFTPIHKTITETNYIVKKYSPFIGGGLSTTPSVIAQGGVFFDDKYGVAAQYNFNWKTGENTYGAIFMLKF